MGRVLLRRAAFYTCQLLLPQIPKISSRTLASFSSSYSQKSIISGQPDETFLPRIYTKSDRIYNICSEDDETDLQLKILRYSEGEEDSDSGSSDSPTYFEIGDGRSYSSEFDWLREISKLSPDSLSESELIPEDSEMVHEDPSRSSEAELVHEDPVKNDNSDSNWKDNFREYRPSGYNLLQSDMKRRTMLQVAAELADMCESREMKKNETYNLLKDIGEEMCQDPTDSTTFVCIQALLSAPNPDDSLSENISCAF